jgi:hypothetical protein
MLNTRADREHPLFTTSQMKSLHYDQCFFVSSAYTWAYMRVLIDVVSSRRNKTNPHHEYKFIPVLHATHVQAFKPKLSTYDQSWSTDQQMSNDVCVSWRSFNRIQFFASCDVAFASDVRCSHHNVDETKSNVDEAASYKRVIRIGDIAIMLLVDRIQDESTNRTITSSQHHRRAPRSLMSRPST